MRAVFAGVRIEAGNREPRPRDAETIDQVARHHPPGLEDQVAREPLRHLLERHMDRDRHHRHLGRPQHHHRPRRIAGLLERQLGEIFGVARVGEAAPCKARSWRPDWSPRRRPRRRSRRRRRDRSRRSRPARWWRPAGRARRVAGRPSATTGRARAKAAAGSCRGDDFDRARRGRAVWRAAPGIAGRREHRRRADRVPGAAAQAASVMSGPMPAGSPRVSASGRDIAAVLPVFDHGLVAQFLEDIS